MKLLFLSLLSLFLQASIRLRWTKAGIWDTSGATSATSVSLASSSSLERKSPYALIALIKGACEHALWISDPGPVFFLSGVSLCVRLLYLLFFNVHTFVWRARSKLRWHLALSNLVLAAHYKFRNRIKPFITSAASDLSVLFQLLKLISVIRHCDLLESLFNNTVWPFIRVKIWRILSKICRK